MSDFDLSPFLSEVKSDPKPAFDLTPFLSEGEPVSENSDRQFYQSGVSLEDRVFEPELSDKIANESTAPLSEIDPERRAK